MPSEKASRYGALAERKAAERYDLERAGEHTSWCDGVDRQGRPHEVKATDLSRDYPRFKIFKTYHERLVEAGGLYVFVAYRRCGRGIRVVKMVRFEAADLPASTWHKNGGHRGSEETKISPEQVL